MFKRIAYPTNGEQFLKGVAHVMRIQEGRKGGRKRRQMEGRGGKEDMEERREGGKEEEEGKEEIIGRVWIIFDTGAVEAGGLYLKVHCTMSSTFACVLTFPQCLTGGKFIL